MAGEPGSEEVEQGGVCRRMDAMGAKRLAELGTATSCRILAAVEEAPKEKKKTKNFHVQNAVQVVGAAQTGEGDLVLSWSGPGLVCLSVCLFGKRGPSDVAVGSVMSSPKRISILYYFQDRRKESNGVPTPRRDDS